MDQDRQRQEVERNFDRFERVLAQLLPEHRDRFALMRDGEILGFYDTPGAADTAGADRFADQIYSIQQVTDEPVEFGIYANAIH